MLPSDPGVTLRRIGPYRVERRLGAGGMGVVYLGRDDAGALVAVKVIKPEYAADRRFRARLRREVAAARRVPRFCTAPVVGADLDAEPPYIATEYIDGPTLDVAVLERGPLRGADLQGLATGIAVALRAIHEQGVIHRDLKPSNILLSSVGPRVIDFGIARLEDAETQLTQDGTVVGTLAYMAPEQLREEELTAAVDLFAWAGMVTYAATGRPPFGTDREVQERILTQDPDVDDLDEPLRGLVVAAFAKDPARRPSAADLVERLSSDSPAMATRVLETAAAPPARPEPDTAPAPAPKRATSPSRPVWRAQPRGEVLSRPSAVARVARRWRWILAFLIAMIPVIFWLVPDGKDPGGFGHQIGDSLTGHSVEGVAVGSLNGRTIAASAGGDETVRLWDLASGKQIGEPLKGHGYTVNSVAFGELNGDPVVVSASAGITQRPFSVAGDNALRVWDVDTHEQLRRIAHTEEYGRAGEGPSWMSVAKLPDGRPVAVSLASSTIRVWNLATGKQVGKSIRADPPMAVGVVNGRTVALTNCYKSEQRQAAACDKGVGRLYDLASGKRYGKDLAGGPSDKITGEVAFGVLNGRPIAVAVAEPPDSFTALRMWDLRTGKLISRPRTGYSGYGIHCLAVGRLPDGRAIAVIGNSDNKLRVVDLASGKPIGEPFTGHDDSIEAVAIGRLNGRPIAVSGGEDKTVRIWNLSSPPP